MDVFFLFLFLKGVQLASSAITIKLSLWSWWWAGVSECSAPSSCSCRPCLQHFQGRKPFIILWNATLIFKCLVCLVLTEHGDEGLNKFAYQSTSVSDVQRPELLSQLPWWYVCSCSRNCQINFVWFMQERLTRTAQTNNRHENWQTETRLELQTTLFQWCISNLKPW